MQQKKFFAFAAVVLAQMVGCASPAPVAPQPSPSDVQAQFGAGASVVDTGSGGNKTIALDLLAPIEAGFKKFGVLTVQHHWTANDIFLYTTTLTKWNGSAYVAIGSGVSTTVNPKASTPQTRAVFTSLKQGSKYQVGIVASGNNGGTAGTTTLNSVIPSNVVYDFTATQDVQDTLSSSTAITFDSVAFTGTASTTLTVPVDGGYTNATSTETGTAQ